MSESKTLCKTCNKCCKEDLEKMEETMHEQRYEICMHYKILLSDIAIFLRKFATELEKLPEFWHHRNYDFDAILKQCKKFPEVD